jgi:hypothetical protein
LRKNIRAVGIGGSNRKVQHVIAIHETALHYPQVEVADKLQAISDYLN